MKIADLSYQSVTPGNPSPNRLGIYADSGTATVFTLTSGGVGRQIGITYTGSYGDAQVATGKGVIGTGTFFGATGIGVNVATGLCSPYKWVPIIDAAGTNLVIPAYLMR